MPNRLYNKQVSPKGYMKGGRIKKAGGGPLKSIDPKKQPGLAKLKKERPDVVAKMGFKKKGGRV